MITAEITQAKENKIYSEKYLTLNRKKKVGYHFSKPFSLNRYSSANEKKPEAGVAHETFHKIAADYISYPLSQFARQKIDVSEKPSTNSV